MSLPPASFRAGCGKRAQMKGCGGAGSPEHNAAFPTPRCAASSRAIEGFFHSDLTDVMQKGDLKRSPFCVVPSISPFGRELRRREKVRLFPTPRCAASSHAIEGIFHSDLTDVKTPQERRLLRGFGAVDRNRTDTGSPPTDFESVASASFTTTAYYGKNYSIVRGKNQAFFLRFLQKHGRRGTM